MKIVSIEAKRYSAPLILPFSTAVRSTPIVEGVAVRIETSDGAFGFGEAPPTAKITGETVGSISSAILETMAPLLIGRDIEEFENILWQVQSSMAHNTSAKAAIDIALHDLRARLFGVPLYALFGGSGAAIESDFTISLAGERQMGEQARKAANDGWRVLKVKLGCGSPEGDARLASAVRKAAPGCELRVDGNQCWGPKEALKAMELMEKAGVGCTLVEQPVPAPDIDDLKFVRDRAPVPIMADEAVFSVRDAVKILEMQAADCVNIKLMKCGGLREASRIASLCDEYGAKAMLGCMMEGKIANAAGSHFASSQGSITMYDVDSPFLIKSDPFKGGPIYDLPWIRFDGAKEGLGIESFPEGAESL